MLTIRHFFYFTFRSHFVKRSTYTFFVFSKHACCVLKTHFLRVLVCPQYQHAKWRVLDLRCFNNTQRVIRARGSAYTTRKFTTLIITTRYIRVASVLKKQKRLSVFQKHTGFITRQSQQHTTHFWRVKIACSRNTPEFLV